MLAVFLAVNSISSLAEFIAPGVSFFLETTALGAYYDPNLSDFMCVLVGTLLAPPAPAPAA